MGIQIFVNGNTNFVNGGDHRIGPEVEQTVIQQWPWETTDFVNGNTNFC
jgi:hypothetical protein